MSKTNPHLKKYVSLSLLSRDRRDDEIVKAATHFSVFTYTGYNHDTGENGRNVQRFASLTEAIAVANKNPRALVYAVLSDIVECHIERTQYERLLVLRKEKPPITELKVGAIYQLTSGHLVQVLRTRADMRRVKIYILDRGADKTMMCISPNGMFAARWDAILPKDARGPKIPRNVSYDF